MLLTAWSLAACEGSIFQLEQKINGRNSDIKKHKNRSCVNIHFALFFLCKKVILLSFPFFLKLKFRDMRQKRCHTELLHILNLCTTTNDFNENGCLLPQSFQRRRALSTVFRPSNSIVFFHTNDAAHYSVLLLYNNTILIFSQDWSACQQWICPLVVSAWVGQHQHLISHSMASWRWWLKVAQISQPRPRPTSASWTTGTWLKMASFWRPSSPSRAQYWQLHLMWRKTWISLNKAQMLWSWFLSFWMCHKMVSINAWMRWEGEPITPVITKW